MANLQLTNFALPGGDLPFKNTSGSSIAAGKVVKLDTSNPASGSTLGGVILTSSAAGAFGITVEAIAAGAQGRVRVYGVYPALNSGGVTAGDVLMANSSGDVLTQTAGNAQIGIALNTATTGEPVMVLICPAKNA